MAKSIALKLARAVPHMRDDLVGVAMLALVDAGRRYDPGHSSGAPFGGFAAMPVRWACMDSLRDHKRPLLKAEELHEIELPPVASSAPGTITKVDLQRAMLGLKPKMRMIIHRLYYQDQPVTTVARHMNISATRVTQIRDTALARIAARLEPAVNPYGNSGRLSPAAAGTIRSSQTPSGGTC